MQCRNDFFIVPATYIRMNFLKTLISCEYVRYVRTSTIHLYILRPITNLSVLRSPLNFHGKVQLTLFTQIDDGDNACTLNTLHTFTTTDACEILFFSVVLCLDRWEFGRTNWRWHNNFRCGMRSSFFYLDFCYSWIRYLSEESLRIKRLKIHKIFSFIFDAYYVTEILSI